MKRLLSILFLSVSLVTLINAQPVMRNSNVKPNISISIKDRKAVADLLNRLLADEYVLYVKLLNYHWNVTGMQFNDLHAFFQRLYEAQFPIVDDVAERVRTLGETPASSMAEFLELARLQEEPTDNIPDARGMLQNLLDDYEAIIRAIRVDLPATERYNDMGTNNFLNDLLEKHEKTAWMLRSLVQQ